MIYCKLFFVLFLLNFCETKRVLVNKNVAFITYNAFNTSDLGVRCSGLLIASNLVLTAGHCFFNDGPSIGVNPHLIKVHLNMEKITPLNLKNSVVPVKKVIINEEYFNMYSEFDMAILVLEKNVIEFCENVHQIKLITNSKTEYSDCFYVGWGSPYESVNEKTLNINAINDVVLKGDLKMKLAKDQSMLTSKIDGKIKAPCTGDSGGPVLCKNAKGLLDMVGVISETSSSAMPNASNKEFCDKTDMVFASSVQFNYKWLQKIVQSNEGSLRC